jgi:3-oxoacyl-[acyl-carrier-protein] synthase II
MGPLALYATLAAQEAVADAGLADDFLKGGEVGAVIGSTTGSPEALAALYGHYLFDNSIEAIKAGEFFKIMGHSCSANVCITLGITGEQWAPTSACTSAAQALGLGYLLVKSGRQQAMLCGGADETHPSVTGVFDVVRAASCRNETPTATPSPFDRKRDGVVCGAGSGILVLESLDSARRRGAHIYGEICGFGHVNDSEHIANPHSTSMARAMARAMAEAGVSGADIDYVNAHATGTEQGDRAEAQAIAMAVNGSVPVSSLKGHFGHTLGAAGALETIILLEMLARQEIVPTLNLEDIDPECDCVDLVRQLRPKPLTTLVKNNFALGGVNAALVIRRVEHDD